MLEQKQISVYNLFKDAFPVTQTIERQIIG
jgi:hypothetical protein